MTDQADTQASVDQTEQGGPAAGTQELHIPKHRFDEVAARLRAKEQEIQMKDQLLSQLSQRLQPQAPQPQGPTPEELGLDPATFQAVQRIAGGTVQQMASKYDNVIANLQGKIEAQQFLLEHGQDKKSYFDRIVAEQRRHAQLTGTYLPIEVAYKMLRADEYDRMDRTRAPARQAGQPPAEQTGGDQGSYPSAQATRVAAPPAVTAAGTAKVETIEEMEARLEREFLTHGSI